MTTDEVPDLLTDIVIIFHTMVAEKIAMEEEIERLKKNQENSESVIRITELEKQLCDAQQINRRLEDQVIALLKRENNE